MTQHSLLLLLPFFKPSAMYLENTRNHWEEEYSTKQAAEVS